MNNLERIKKAWGMGWSATLNVNGVEANVVGFIGEDPLIDAGFVITQDLLSKWETKITGYKYAGELAGNEIPDNGQMFKRKGQSGHLFWGEESLRDGSGMILHDDDGDTELYDCQEIFPYFV